MDYPRLTDIDGRYAVIAFVLQVLSYAALVGAVEHGDVTPLVESVRRLPTVVLVLLSVPAVPAVLLTIGIGAPIDLLSGGALHRFGPGLVTEGDGLFLVVAAVLSLLVDRLLQRRRERLSASSDG